MMDVLGGEESFFKGKGTIVEMTFKEVVFILIRIVLLDSSDELTDYGQKVIIALMTMLFDDIN